MNFIKYLFTYIHLWWTVRTLKGEYNELYEVAYTFFSIFKKTGKRFKIKLVRHINYYETLEVYDAEHLDAKPVFWVNSSFMVSTDKGENFTYFQNNMSFGYRLGYDFDSGAIRDSHYIHRVLPFIEYYSSITEPYNLKVPFGTPVNELTENIYKFLIKPVEHDSYNIAVFNSNKFVNGTMHGLGKQLKNCNSSNDLGNLYSKIVTNDFDRFVKIERMYPSDDCDDTSLSLPTEETKEDENVGEEDTESEDGNSFEATSKQIDITTTSNYVITYNILSSNNVHKLDYDGTLYLLLELDFVKGFTDTFVDNYTIGYDTPEIIKDILHNDAATVELFFEKENGWIYEFVFCYLLSSYKMYLLGKQGNKNN